MYFRIIKKVFAIYQPEKMLILSKKGWVSQLYGIIKRHMYGKQKN